MAASGHTDMTVYHKHYAKPRKWSIMRLVNGDSGVSPDIKKDKIDKKRKKTKANLVKS